MVKGTKSIKHYKLAKWVEDNFQDNVIKIDFIGEESASIVDKNGHKAIIILEKETDNIIIKEYHES